MADASVPLELGDIWTYFAERECGEYSPLYNRICRTGVVDLFADIAVPSDAHGMRASILGLVVFRDGAPQAEHLGFVHPHGTWIDWRA